MTTLEALASRIHREDDYENIMVMLSEALDAADAKAYARGWRERGEADAKVCEELFKDHYDHSGYKNGAEACALTIRAPTPPPPQEETP